MKDTNSLPIRIDIYYAPEKKGVAENQRSKITSLARETHSQMDTEVRLELITFAGSGESTFFLRQGKITTFHAHAMQRPDGGSKPLSSGQVNPNDLEQHILWRLTKPKNVPLTFRIEYDKISNPDGTEYVYRGYLDEEGNLIVDREQIYPQGSFHEYGPSQTILKKVE